MRFASSSPRQLFAISLSSIIAAALFTTGCGSGGSTSTTQLSGSTPVTVVLSSTANDQLTEFDLDFQGITLTSQSGKTATLLPPASAAGAEFMHINGTAEPLVTATIPQDIYTSATVSLGMGLFVCVALGPENGQSTLSTAFYDNSASPVTVTLPSPITVTGNSMALSLDLLVSQSATIGDCLNVDGFYGFSIAPTFNLTPLTIVSSPTNATNGRVAGVDGQITAMGTTGSSFTLSLPSAEGPRTLSISSSNNTEYQGVGNFSALAAGTFVDMDGAIQADGSLLATRIAVEDSSAADVFRGPLMEVAPSDSVVLIRAREQQGKDFPGYVGGFGSLNFGGAVFQTSGQLSNLGSLPFVPSFDATNMVPGQEVYISIASFSVDVPYPTATTMTLMPQTVNGTVMAVSSIGNFIEYTVSLAAYDLLPMLAGQPQQTTVEINPSQIEVYVDSNTQKLNTQPLAAGSTLRFYGLVFNDSGTLRMDCAQVNDGVDFTPQPNANERGNVAQAQITRRAGPGGIEQINTVTTNSQ